MRSDELTMTSCGRTKETDRQTDGRTERQTDGRTETRREHATIKGRPSCSHELLNVHARPRVLVTNLRIFTSRTTSFVHSQERLWRFQTDIVERKRRDERVLRLDKQRQWLPNPAGCSYHRHLHVSSTKSARCKFSQVIVIMHKSPHQHC